MNSTFYEFITIGCLKKRAYHFVGHYFNKKVLKKKSKQYLALFRFRLCTIHSPDEKTVANPEARSPFGRNTLQGAKMPSGDCSHPGQSSY